MSADIHTLRCANKTARINDAKADVSILMLVIGLRVEIKCAHELVAHYYAAGDRERAEKFAAIAGELSLIRRRTETIGEGK